MRTQVRCRHQIGLPATAETPLVISAVQASSYPVCVCQTEQRAVSELIREISGKRVALVTDDTVAALHAKALADQLREFGLNVSMTSFPPGEASKSMPTACDLLDWLAGTSIARRDVLLAVGGGVVIDTVGWVASAYMRGIPYINVPTTLLADVDAALGGKVAVDHSFAKNLIGAFHQPKAVVSNVSYLATVSRRHLAAGLAEAIKKGVIGSPALFEFIETEADRVLAHDMPVLARLVRAASAVKRELLARDPYEQDLCRPLNFGHTVGHAVETVTGYGPVLHGEAVAYGMAVAARIASTAGLLDNGVKDRLVTLLRRVGLPTEPSHLAVPVSFDAIIAALGQIRKIRDGKLRFVLPVCLGEAVIVEDLSDAEVRAALPGEEKSGMGGDLPR